MSAAETLRFALVATPNRVGDLDLNLERHLEWMRRARDRGADVVAFPECSLTGYGGGREHAIGLRDERIDRVRALAEEIGVRALVGLAERAGTHVHSSCALVGPSGVVGATRKINCIPEEDDVFAAGHDLPVFEVKGRRIGIAICADASVYEVPKILALRGAEIVFCPHANAHPGLRGDPQQWKSWRLRTWRRFLPDCGVYMLGCNLAGDETETGRARFCGGALALDPLGELLAQTEEGAAGESMVLVDLPRRENPARPLLDCLRPEILYGRSRWVFGRRASATSLESSECGAAAANVAEPSTADQATYWCAGAIAFHRMSSLGNYPIPTDPVRARMMAARVPEGVQAAAHALSSMSVGSALDRRRSTRQFGPAALAQTSLSALLWAGYGRQSQAADGEQRTVPSPGGFYALKAFVVARHVEGLAPGLYAYDPSEHRLSLVRAVEISAHRWFHDADDIRYEDASAWIVLVAQLDTVAGKYGERAYRHVLLEAGHVGQSISLAATVLDVACVAAGGFDDRAVADDIPLAHAGHLPVHCIVVGSR
jgi:SagB-type dehydrogenase family enzyme